MSGERLSYRKFPSRCECGWVGPIWGWWHEDRPCPECGKPTVFFDNQTDRSAAVIGDDIPGGLLVPNAICHEDGTPKRYYSRTDLKRALNEKGWTIVGDTPKPYRVSTSRNALDDR